MTICNVVLSTEPQGGKGGVATVIPMYLEALEKLGTTTEFIPTHVGGGVVGKILPWIFSFFRCVGIIARNRKDRVFFHLHPGSGFCLIRMLLLAIFLRHLARQRVFVYLHTPYLESYLNSRFWSVVIRGLLKTSDRVIVLTSYALEIIKKNCAADNIRVIPNPFRPISACAPSHAPGTKKLERLRGQPKEQGATERGAVTVLVMGRLVEGKGFLEAVRALPYLPRSYRIVIAGEGQLNARIREEVFQLRLENRVEMKGWVFGEAKELLFAEADVFCLPSRVDSFGMSFIEAQVHDLPVVAFKHPPVIEVIRSTAAILVESLAPHVVARAIEDANSLKRGIAPGSGRTWVESRFGVESVGNRLNAVINEFV